MGAAAAGVTGAGLVCEGFVAAMATAAMPTVTHSAMPALLRSFMSALPSEPRESDGWRFCLTFSFTVLSNETQALESVLN